MKLEIFTLFADQQNYLDYQDKGWRDDIIVKKDEEYFNLNLYTIESFSFDVNTMIRKQNEVIMDTNILIVKDMTYNSIINAIIKNFQNNYFDNIKSCEVYDGKIKFVMNKNTYNSYTKANIQTEIKISELIKISEHIL